MKYKLPKTGNIAPLETRCKKTVYESKDAAQDAIAYVMSGSRVKLETYQCTICGFWHLTSKKKEDN
jgi:hypothetical protein